MSKQTNEERLAKKREWYQKNIEKSKATAKKSREKHKEKRNLENKLWAEKNKEYLKAYQKEYHKKWYEKNKEKRSAQLKKYSELHKEDNVKRTQKYTAKNKTKVYNYGKLYNQTLEGSYRTYKSGSLKRKKEFELTFEVFSELKSRPCTYCGEISKKIGIDRIDNSKGYTIENSTPCCTICNMMKKTLDVKDFIDHITKIYKNNLLA